MRYRILRIDMVETGRMGKVGATYDREMVTNVSRGREIVTDPSNQPK